MRSPYDSSFLLLKERVEIVGDVQPQVSRPPRHDDEELGPSIFRLLLEDVKLEDLTVPGLYVAHSELRRISFCGSDLHLSAVNWTDLSDCDFTGADLSRSDLRACKFVRCLFRSANLVEADLRGSVFEGCEFTDALLTGAKLFRRSKLLGLFRAGDDQSGLPLSTVQRAAISWSSDSPSPGGG
jgi:uncharacterized protein YjbI with pentapeptide repeats